MEFRVLGCSGGIGGAGQTSSFLIGSSILVDAGTGLGRLSQESLEEIDHVFVSHSHTDHISLLPLLADATLEHRRKPIVVHGTEATLDVLSRHIFNWEVSPDFRVLPTAENPTLVFSPLQPGQPVSVDGCRITAIPVKHSIPTVAYQVDSDTGSLVLATDMGRTEGFWSILNSIKHLRYLLIETAFQNARIELCRESGHFCPSVLEEELRLLEQPETKICIVHVKPGSMETVGEEIRSLKTDRALRLLRDNDILEF